MSEREAQGPYPYPVPGPSQAYSQCLSEVRERFRQISEWSEVS